MRTIKQILILALVVLLIGTVVTAVYKGSSDRTVGPTIQCEEDGILFISASAMESELLTGITASDPQDGDLTDRVMVAGVSKLITNDTAKVTYLVFDSDDNMASYVRRIRYYDYHKPVFQVDPDLPLVYSNLENVTVLDRVSAWDVIEGDISGRVRVSTLAPTEDPHIYDVTVQVTNSMGDTAWLQLPVLHKENDPQCPVVELEEYLLYLELGQSFEPMDYLSAIRLPDGGNGALTDVVIDDPVDTAQADTYRVTYTYQYAGSVGKAILTVVVQ